VREQLVASRDLPPQIVTKLFSVEGQQHRAGSSDEPFVERRLERARGREMNVAVLAVDRSFDDVGGEGAEPVAVGQDFVDGLRHAKAGVAESELALKTRPNDSSELEANGLALPEERRLLEAQTL